MADRVEVPFILVKSTIFDPIPYTPNEFKNAQSLGTLLSSDDPVYIALVQHFPNLKRGLIINYNQETRSGMRYIASVDNIGQISVFNHGIEHQFLEYCVETFPRDKCIDSSNITKRVDLFNQKQIILHGISLGSEYYNGKQFVAQHIDWFKRIFYRAQVVGSDDKIMIHYNKKTVFVSRDGYNSSVSIDMFGKHCRFNGIECLLADIVRKLKIYDPADVVVEKPADVVAEKPADVVAEKPADVVETHCTPPLSTSCCAAPPVASNGDKLADLRAQIAKLMEVLKSVE